MLNWIVSYIKRINVFYLVRLGVRNYKDFLIGVKPMTLCTLLIVETKWKHVASQVISQNALSVNLNIIITVCILTNVIRDEKNSNNTWETFFSTDEEAAHYQLDVDLSTLTFTHHPLFSKEHVLASRLQQYYKQYTERRRKAMSSHYSDKVFN